MVVVALALVAGCGDDDDDAGRSGTTGTTVEDETPTTQPASSDESAVRPYIEDLLAAWDAAMTPILGDPRAVADDSESPLREELAESFTVDSPSMSNLDDLLATYISQDTGIHPGPNGLVQETTMLHFTEAPDDDHVSFVFCSFSDGIEYALSTGEERPPSVGVRQGSGAAARVDGRWLLESLQQLGFEEHPAGTANPCPALATPEGQ
jgi:hypothetical protein